MIPPWWALRNASRLDIDGFQSHFASAWSSIKFRFLKLECWQTYLELEANESQDAYGRGDFAGARASLNLEAEADRPLYKDIQEHGIDYARIRLIQEPLTDYLRYELMAYDIRERMGENIEVVRSDPLLLLPNDDYFDWLLFDRHTALIHDYGQGEAGLQSGGWVTRDTTTIATLESKAAALRRTATSLADFLKGLQRR